MVTDTELVERVFPARLLWGFARLIARNPDTCPVQSLEVILGFSRHIKNELMFRGEDPARDLFDRAGRLAEVVTKPFLGGSVAVPFLTTTHWLNARIAADEWQFVQHSEFDRAYDALAGYVLQSKRNGDLLDRIDARCQANAVEMDAHLKRLGYYLERVRGESVILTSAPCAPVPPVPPPPRKSLSRLRREALTGRPDPSVYWSACGTRNAVGSIIYADGA